MDISSFQKYYDISGKTAVVTGGAGVLCAAMCRALVAVGAKVAVLDLNAEAAENLAADIRANGGDAIGAACNVLDKASLEAAAQEVLAKFGRVDILVNGAGGNKPQATTNAEQSFFDLPTDALRWVFDLNLMGTILPSQVFGKIMAAQKSGVILNISSMNAFRPLTRIPAYSAAKAGVSNFTQWLAVHMAQEYSAQIRVNAIAPGFFIGDQNRRLLLDEDGSLTRRGQSILDHTPMKRFGAPEDLLGALLWLVSPAAAFVTGIVVPVDGGFSAFSGV
ncbi:MAG: D-mannonate oxidoreductase [Anaerolineae bacterium CG_4_8_14_3_um_filter_59_70]|nr:MAG: D-mannonate oxidoreductase [Anaerolineae bacterium CG_4_8_14_3_um_filter_59_70]